MAENLWSLREQKKISVATLANRAGLPIGLIMEYESGQRSLDPRHLSRIARALYVEETDIKLHSDPRPGAAPLERQPAREGPHEAPRPPMARAPVPSGKPRERAPRPRTEPKPPASPRPSQIAHLETMLKRLSKTPADLETEIGKPIANLDRQGVSNLLKDLQAKIREVPSPARHRAYLPESVDEFEAKYLSAAQEAQAQLHFTLFDGTTVDGQIVGFGPYNITARRQDGSEVSMNKLALVSYVKLTGKKSGEQTP